MHDLYKQINLLCKKSNISVTTLCKEAKISRASLSDLKAGRSHSLSVVTIKKITAYFNTPIEFLLGEQPFTYWDEMLADKSGVIQALLKESTVSSEFLRAVYGPRKDDFSDIGDYEFMLLVSSEIGSATPLDDSWVITLDPIYCTDETKRETSVLGDLSDSRKRFIQEVRDMSDADFNAILAFYDYVKRNRDTDV